MSRIKTFFRHDNVGLLFALPAVVYMLVFVGYPIVHNIVLGFQDVDVMNFLHEAGYNPNLIISGRESRRESWFKNTKGIFELIVPKLNEVSGTMVRDLIKKDKAEEWKRCVPDLLWEDYNTIRSIVVESSDNINTQSI